jgi:hypothetical protein
MSSQEKAPNRGAAAVGTTLTRGERARSRVQLLLEAQGVNERVAPNGF